MDWLGAISVLLGIMLIILGVGMTFSIDIIETVVEKFLGVIAIIFGVVLLSGGYMIVKQE
ncbi:MFS transporter permease [Methanoplanus endosymbiosus]|uniref:MFS transporter permease n=1 Tax=Methanoplanus endosymbiosus TaxID=33865 RepID=A0A9E7PNL9_9EURY|nr:MFS transporter permease [Methanoplanus endosymbiosus]UUX93588.1 MFS transporter permease [Methanoplanus endosymbiosus]